MSLLSRLHFYDRIIDKKRLPSRYFRQIRYIAIHFIFYNVFFFVLCPVVSEKNNKKKRENIIQIVIYNDLFTVASKYR